MLSARRGRERGFFGCWSFCSGKQRPSAGAAGVFPSLLVEIRADFSHIKVVNDKTGCHRFGCSVSWTWFLLWAGRAALHFYSSPPKTIPCVIRLRKLSEEESGQLGGSRCKRNGVYNGGSFTPIDRGNTSFTTTEVG